MSFILKRLFIYAIQKVVAALQSINHYVYVTRPMR